MIYEINIMMGLPGSGKTTFVKEEENEFFKYRYSTLGTDKKYLDIIDLDAHKDCENLEDALTEAFADIDILKKEYSIQFDKKILYIDGLILTVNQLNTVINFCKEYLTKYEFDEIEKFIFNIHYWDKDRYTCVQNDKLRVYYGIRNESAFTTITKCDYADVSDLVYENTDTESYNIINHEVYKASAYDIYFKPKSIYVDGKQIIQSESWSLGGEWGDCWGNSGIIEPEEQPKRFVEFDNFINKIYPDIKHSDYVKLYDECVTVHEYNETGYYGTYENIAEYRCDMNKLYNMMKELNLIN